MTPEQLDALRGHTPGPWRIEMQDNYMKLYFPEKHTGVSGDVARGYVGCANAQLIAAAPDLLAHIDEQPREMDRLRDENDRLKVLLSETQSPCFPHVPAWFAEVVSLILKQEAGNDT